MFQVYTDKVSDADDVSLLEGTNANPAFPVVSQIFPDFQSRMRISGRWILAADIGALLLSYLAGQALAVMRDGIASGRFTVDWSNLVSFGSSFVFLGIGTALLLWLDSRGHYRQRLPFWEMAGHILGASTVGFAVSGFIEFASHDLGSRLHILMTWIVFAFCALTGRFWVRRYLGKIGAWQIPALVIGDGATAKNAMRAISGDAHLGFTIMDQLPSSILSDMHKTSAWKQILVMHDAHYIFLALEGAEIERFHAALKSLPRARVPFSIVPPWVGLPSSTLTPHHFVMQDVMMMHDTNRLKLPLPCLMKRMVDVVLSGTALLVLIPVFLLVAIMIRRDGGPAVFSQPRVGRGGRFFECYKFRSMRVDAEEALDKYLAQNPEAADEWRHFQKLKNDVRVTAFGRRLRRYSIDELPQLFNVLKGDMSLVGPRPCMAGQERLYADDFSFYESVRPGITGPWQVSGRNQLTFRERVALEAWYARNWSLWLDIVIMLKTVPTLLKREQAF